MNSANTRNTDKPRLRGVFVVTVFLVFFLASGTVRAADESPAPSAGFGNVGSTAGIGHASTLGGGPSGWGYHMGGRFQLNAGPTQSYGIEASYVVPVANGSAGRYLALGIVLEQTVWQWAYMAIGTVGYIGVDGTRGDPFGVVTDLGVGHLFAGRFRPSLTYRSEFVFAPKIITIDSLSLGLDVVF